MYLPNGSIYCMEGSSTAQRGLSGLLEMCAADRRRVKAVALGRQVLGQPAQISSILSTNGNELASFNSVACLFLL